MGLFTKTPKLDALIKKEIVITNGRGWSKCGTILTNSELGGYSEVPRYKFVYQQNKENIALVDVNDGELKRLSEKNNIYLFQPKTERGTMCVAVGADYPMLDAYNKLIDVLDYASRNWKLAERK